MSECTHDCETCKEKCAAEKPKCRGSVKNVIGIVSGKGGVGKSLVTALLAVAARRQDYSTAILDADITGPSIPKMFGLHEMAHGSKEGILPVATKTGIDVMSLNLLTDDETAPVVWRGPIIAGTVCQFWTDVAWGEKDLMFVDMPPGTGDVPLTVMQSLPLTGIVVVTSPQELVSMIVEKALKMANMMTVPVLGLVENMSYATCPDCGKKIEIFGHSNAETLAKKFSLPLIARLPFEPKLARACDAGLVELVDDEYLEGFADLVEKTAKK